MNYVNNLIIKVNIKVDIKPLNFEIVSVTTEKANSNLEALFFCIM